MLSAIKFKRESYLIMKKHIHNLFILFIVILTACSKESEILSDKTIEDMTPNTITTPCDFNLSNVKENSTIIINCLLDLNKKTITLPANVNFEFGKGDIINGKLIFNGGTIAGELLNSTLEIEGNVKLINPIFQFYASRWNIVEGETTSEIAQNNNDELERLMEFTKLIGAIAFQVDKLDAYFQVHYPTPPYSIVFHPSIEAVNIPSDFNLTMSNNTYLRIFPGTSENKTGSILAVNDAENITITGGNLIGDRDKRAYPSGQIAGQYGAHLLKIRSGRNITLNGVKFINGSAGSLNINSIGFSFNPNTYNPTTNVTVKNCVFENSRRMSIALTEGRDIKILNNTFTNTGNESTNSSGGEVGYAINIEPTRTRDSITNELKEYERAFDILIKGNTEIGSRGGFLTATIGQDITVENNTIGTRVVSSYVSNTKIINNTFKARGKATESWAIFLAGDGETVFNNEVANNNIDGYSTGIVVGSLKAEIHHNTITNVKAGIQLSKAKEIKIYSNKIITAEKGKGLTATNTYNNDIEIKNNEINSDGFHVYFAQLNDKVEHSNNTLLLDGNTFLNSKQVSFSNTVGITFKNNNVTGGLQIGGASKIEISTNIIRPNESDGIRLYGDNTDVSLLNNTIYEPTGASRFVCINNNSNNPNAITITTNTCN